MVDVDQLLESPPIDPSQKDFWDYDIESLMTKYTAMTLAELVTAQRERGYVPTIDTRLLKKPRDREEKTAKDTLANELTRRGINVYHNGKYSLRIPSWDDVVKTQEYARAQVPPPPRS